MNRRQRKLAERARRERELEESASLGLPPQWERPGVNPATLESSSSIGPVEQPVDIDEEERPSGPPRVTGEMVWTHKTAPILQIHGKKPISPDDLAAGRRR